MDDGCSMAYTSKWHLWLFCNILWQTKNVNIKNVTISRPQSVSSRAEGAPLRRPSHLNKVLPFLLTALWHLHGSGGGRFMSLVKRWTRWVTARVVDPLWETAHKKQPVCGSFWKQLVCVCVPKPSTITNGVCSKTSSSPERRNGSLSSKLATRHQSPVKRPTLCPF